MVRSLLVVRVDSIITTVNPIVGIHSINKRDMKIIIIMQTSKCIFFALSLLPLKVEGDAYSVCMF